MKRALGLGFVLFIGFVVAFAPAGLLRRATDNLPGLDLTQPSGTIWHGAGQIIVDGRLIGTVRWAFQPLSILRLAPAYNLELEGEGLDLIGTIEATTDGTHLEVAGRAEANLFNQYFSTYDLVLSGALSISTLTATLAGGKITHMDGEARWSGGPVRYVLSGRLAATELPPLVAFIKTNQMPTADIFAEGGQTPLMHVQILESGFVKIGVTKSLTKMLNNPWPGGDPDHAVVLEVEEKIF